LQNEADISSNESGEESRHNRPHCEAEGKRKI
jgi:hypothetical protein